ncbi:Exonuclease family protein [Spironucleus salmonicida]|uniref:Exonuclease family protein n=1 Tax=Spironucleus salmonicida TaxID=348837 RepID=V6LHH9_9EUKA|nr:Exonuclease family protein [Spironucleus salmonicida]|eukprot:EST43748.1 Exonuclease family protein [Spironucleus salmonicida]
MGVKNLSSILPKKQLPANYFCGKTIAMDFYNFAFTAAPFAGFDLIQHDNVQSFFTYFKSLIRKILSYQDASVILCYDGQLLAGKAPVSLPRMQRRQKLRSQITKNMSKTEVRKLCTKGFTITRNQCSRVFEMLCQSFDKDHFNVLCAPYEADFQIEYLAQSQMIDCVLSSDSDMALLGIDVIMDFGSNIQTYIDKVDMTKFIDQFDGIENLTKCCMLKGNDYFPGFDVNFQDALDKLRKNKYNLLQTAFQLNQERYIMSQVKIIKAFFLAYSVQIYPFIFDFNIQKIRNLNQISEDDADLLEYCFESNIIGSTEFIQNPVKYISGYDLDTKNQSWLQSNEKQRFESALKSKFYRTPTKSPKPESSILKLLQCVKTDNFKYCCGQQEFDLSQNSYHTDYLLKQSKQDQNKFLFGDLTPVVLQKKPKTSFVISNYAISIE